MCVWHSIGGDGQTDRQKDRQRDRQTERQSDRQRDRERERKREKDGQTDGQKDRQTDRQTDSTRVFVLAQRGYQQALVYKQSERINGQTSQPDSLTDR